MDFSRSDWHIPLSDRALEIPRRLGQWQTLCARLPIHSGAPRCLPGSLPPISAAIGGKIRAQLTSASTAAWWSFMGIVLARSAAGTSLNDRAFPAKITMTRAARDATKKKSIARTARRVDISGARSSHLLAAYVPRAARPPFFGGDTQPIAHNRRLSAARGRARQRRRRATLRTRRST